MRTCLACGTPLTSAFFPKRKSCGNIKKKALKNALIVLHRYYEKARDYEPDEDLESANDKRIRELVKSYEDVGVRVDEEMSFDVKKEKVTSLIESVWQDILTDHYDSRKKLIHFQPFANRMCFWMATGSVKILVLIELIVILRELMRRKEIPENDILVLTHREDLIAQLKNHVWEFNGSNPECEIVLHELKEYANVKNSNPNLFLENQIHIFYYRSDNLTEEQKEKQIDFRNYDNGGRWYVFLDEAHKGDHEDSKRKWIYSLLSRQGFLFNFSATFTDKRDIIATVYEFNLSSYIKDGYGKHLFILEQEVRAFREDEPYTDDEKQKIVLKSLLLLTYCKKFAESVRAVDKNMYHSPLMLTLVNSVNVEDADLELFFRELVKIGNGEVSNDMLNECKEDLRKEFNSTQMFLFEEETSEKAQVNHEKLKGINLEEILKYAYNAPSQGSIEVLVRRSNRQELAFKLKAADMPFGLIKIGDISGWLSKKLTGYEIQERYEDDAFFENLNRDDSSINILMGSRTFYEGWDSNRPNVIFYINIGVGEEARKFILQSVGRGARIEPIKGKRRRAGFLKLNYEMDEGTYRRIEKDVQPLETLFVIGTNRDAIKFVLESLKNERKEAKVIKLKKNPAASGKVFLIPVYRVGDEPIVKKRKKFPLSRDNLKTLKRALECFDERVLIALLVDRYRVTPRSIRLLRDLIKEEQLKPSSEIRTYKSLEHVLESAFSYMDVWDEDVDKFVELSEEIKHFNNIRVYLEDVAKLEEKITQVEGHGRAKEQKVELMQEVREGKLDPDDAFKKAEKVLKECPEEVEFEYERKRLVIRYIEPHYYLPVITATDERVDYISHIIKEDSEVRFIDHIVDSLRNARSLFEQSDWWMFSKIDESQDEVYIPYLNHESGRISRWYPDFIFWLQKGSDYFIVFIDPKEHVYTTYEQKVEGYKRLFNEEDGRVKVFSHNGFSVRVYAYLWTTDSDKLIGNYRDYWFEDIEGLLSKVLRG